MVRLGTEIQLGDLVGLQQTHQMRALQLQIGLLLLNSAEKVTFESVGQPKRGFG